MVKTRVRRHNKRRLLFLALLVVLVLGAGTLFLFHIGPFHKQTPITASQYTKGEPAQNTNQGTTPTSSGTSGTATQNQKGSTSTGNSGTKTALLTPSGDFVSDHHPNLSGTPAPNTLESVCNTSPGATCQITFTMGALIKSLPAQTTDSGGATYWNWKLQTYGLTVGSWQVKAIASLDGQTKTAADAQNLEISQ